MDFVLGTQDPRVLQPRGIRGRPYGASNSLAQGRQLLKGKLNRQRQIRAASQAPSPTTRTKDGATSGDARCQEARLQNLDPSCSLPGGYVWAGKRVKGPI
jgi:hypothetical protein